MKPLLIFAAGLLLATGPAFAQDAPSTNISAPVVRRNALPPPNAAAQTEGSIQRAVRLGSPLQMVNPAAPREYGSGQEFVIYRNRIGGLQTHGADRPAGAPMGLRLFSFSFW